MKIKLARCGCASTGLELIYVTSMFVCTFRLYLPLNAKGVGMLQWVNYMQLINPKGLRLPIKLCLGFMYLLLITEVVERARCQIFAPHLTHHSPPCSFTISQRMSTKCTCTQVKGLPRNSNIPGILITLSYNTEVRITLIRMRLKRGSFEI